jgi:O-antigen/teichoic acid export membrane protein
MKVLRNIAYKALRYTERYTKTDMVYLTRGGFWLTLGQAASAICSFAIAIIFARYLSKDVYGNYKYILSLAGLLGAFTLTGISTAMSRSVTKGFEGSLIYAVKISLKWSFISSMISLCCSVYYYLNDNIPLSISLLIISLFSPIISGFSMYDSYLSGKKDFRLSAIFQVLLNFSTSALLILAVTNGSIQKNPVLLVLAYFVFNAIVVCVLFTITLHIHKPNREIDPTMTSYGKHLSIINMLNVVAAKIDSILIFHYLGAINLAIYSFAIAIPEQMKGVVKNLTQLSFPKFAGKSLNEINTSFGHKFFIMSCVLVIAVIAYILATPLIFHILFPQYVESIVYSKIYALSLLGSLASLPLNVFESHADKDVLYKVNVFGAILQIATLAILVPFYGIMGAVVARIITRFLVLIVIYSTFRKAVRAEKTTA